MGDLVHIRRRPRGCDPRPQADPAADARTDLLMLLSDAERAQAAWYLALGDRVTAGEATDRAEDLEREALLQLRSIDDQ